MKRTAEAQLSKDDPEDDYEIEETSLQGFKKANESELASRPMRGLPKRGGGGAAAASPFAPVTSKPDITSSASSFKGFGSTTSSSTPFTFSSGATGFAASNTTTSQPVTTNTPFKFGGLGAVSSTASPATKEFASFISSGVYTNGKPKSETTADTGMAPAATSNADDVEYFSSLLGLNESFLSAVQNLLTRSRFADLSTLFKHYSEFRAKIQKEHDAKGKTSTPSVNGAATSSGSPMPASGSPSPWGSANTDKSSPAPLKPPAAPKSFSGFGGSAFPPTSSSSTPTSTGGFKPVFSSTSTSSSATSSPFTFSAPSDSNTASKPSIFGGADGAAGSTSSTTSEKAATSTNSGSKFTFGSGDASSTSKPLLFGASSAATPSEKPASSGFGATPSIFGGSSIFGAGSSSSSTSLPGSIFGKTPTTFGGASAGFTFNAPKTSTFGQSNATEASGVENAKVESAEESESNATGSRADTPASVNGTEGEGSAQRVLGENPNDKEGEGEENEVTVHTCRASLYIFGEKEDKKQWIGRGVGMVRVKKSKTDNSRRLLSRNSSTGKIMINFKLYPGLTTKRDKNSLSLTGHEDGKEANFRLRVKDEATLIALQEAIDKAVSEL